MKLPRASHVHYAATVAWTALVLPTALWWRDSVFWVALISCYANVVSHVAAYEAARAKELHQEDTAHPEH